MGLRGNINETDNYADLTPGRPGSAGANASETNVAGQQQFQGQTQAPSWNDLDQLSIADNTLSKSAQDYLDNLAKNMDDYAKRCRLEPIQIIALNEPTGAYMLVSGDYVRPLLLSEAVPTLGQDLPTVLNSYPALMRFKAQSNGNIKPVPTIVVHPEDYGRVAIMAKDIVKTFLALVKDQFENFNILEFQKAKYEFDFSREAYDRYLQQNDPHEVPARADLTLVMTRDEFNKDAAAAAKIANTSYDRSTGYVRKVCFVVGAYVDFIATNAVQGIQYIPELHISYIDSTLPVSALIPVAISVATQAWAQSGKWVRSFEDLSAGRPNLGTLFLDEHGVPSNFTSVAELEDNKNKYIYKDASVVIDVPFGRAMPAGLALYSSPDQQGKIIDTLNRFFLTNEFSGANVVSTTQYSEIIGYANVPGGKYVDSRYCDYVSLATQSPQTAASLTPLLSRSLATDARIRSVQEKTNTVITPLYMEDVVAINAEVLGRIQAKLGSVLSGAISGITNIIDPNVAIANATAIRNIAQSAYVQGYAQNVGGYVAGNMNWY